MKVLTMTDLPLPLVCRGKVRDLYDYGDKLLIVATDRVSAFDVILNEPIPFKGSVLTQLSKFWFEKTYKIARNHFITTDLSSLPPEIRSVCEGRAMLVHRATPLPVECIVRGYITGSALKEYKRSGEVCGIKLKEGLAESERLPEPIFTPTTKAELGKHDQNMTLDEVKDLIGEEMAEEVHQRSLALYSFAQEYAVKRGIIIADTKFEFGLVNGKLTLIDEVLTPDSSRFWSRDDYRSGYEQASFDKQLIRNYLERVKWNKIPPPPRLPQEVVSQTSAKYTEIMNILIT
ncbi:MAG: phosphoribosylaminoimidazolesuccinocarboxamide synthase [Deferribacteraceae bacterium]|jgi:phosphoribosylaminoimidazole-succinocarboxamide synthase|nr:phosphoribosylaminoimidazolesuccinocarboxamide synthase [Deferribacteraceae bacterium]